MPPLRFAELIYCSSVSIFSPPPSAEIKVIPPTALSRRNDTEISSLRGMLHEGPDRLAQWVSQGWLATADTQEDSSVWIRYEWSMTQKNFLLVWWKITYKDRKKFRWTAVFSVLETFCSRMGCLPCGWRHHLNETFTEPTLRCSFLSRPCCPCTERHTTRRRLLCSTEQTRDFGILLYSFRLRLLH